jgi:hypothetical protein
MEDGLMAELSPAARAVLTAVTLTKYDVPPEGLPAFAEEMAPLLAAALRATAQQVEDLYCDDLVIDDSDGAVFVLRQLMLIADELEAHQNSQ